MKFKGDIIITDPCYIDTKDDKLWNSNNIDTFSGDGISSLGFTSYIWDSTIYGDWSCTTFELKADSVNIPIEDLCQDNTKSILGHFCADAGLVGVFLLKEILAFNPDFKYQINEYGVEWATLIKDFDGEIEYEIVDDEAFIKGVGNINFITRQTGF